MSRARNKDYRDPWDVINLNSGKIAQLHRFLMELLVISDDFELRRPIYFRLIGKNRFLHRTNEDMKCEISVMTFACH